MTIEQKLLSKLAPHAKRITDGDCDDFDYLPAVLLQLMEEQKRQAKLLESFATYLDAIKNATDTAGAQIKAQIAASESAAQRKLEQIDAVIKDAQNQFQYSQSSVMEQVAAIASAQSAHVTQANQGMSGFGVQIESLTGRTQRSDAIVIKLLIAGLVASTAMIGLAVAILQRH